MIDRGAFSFVPNDITGLFRRLNGAPMYDILDTLDALLKEKNFYPNADRYRAELNRAGIFAARMEVAMGAVMAKNGKTVSYDQFTSTYSLTFAQLPEDQRENIKVYYTGSSAGPAISDEKLVAQYLAWANRAVFQTRALLKSGAGNRLDDLALHPLGAPAGTIRSKIYSSGRQNLNAEQTAEIARKAGGGNCDEFSATAFVELKKMNARPIHWVKLVTGDHAFCLVGPGPLMRLDDKDLARWGKSVVVCDAWSNESYIASEIPKRLPDYKAPFDAQVYQTVTL